MALLASNASWGLFAFGVLMVIFMLTRRSRRYLSKTRREQNQPVTRLVEPNRDRALVDAPREVLRWQVEMHETARDLKAELDSKMGALQALVRQASAESARLEAAIQRAERLGISTSRDTLREIERLADDDASQPRLPQLGGVVFGDPHRDQIYSLADGGLAAPTIAAQLGASIGDVEMVLSLRTE